MTGDSIIEVKKLVKHYKGSVKNAVDGVSFRVRENDIFGLIGPNGAGKSSTINILTGRVAYTSGEITIAGYDLRKNLKQIKHVIGIVPQDIALYPSLNAYQNLYIFGNIYGLRGKVLRNRIDELVELYGIDNYKKNSISDFSGGIKRRINIIAGILNKPKILFLDEPTVGLDVQSNNLIMENLKALNKNGTSIIYTSHYLLEAQGFCNYIAIIDEGKLINRGSPSELIADNQGCGSLEDVYLKLTGHHIRD